MLAAYPNIAKVEIQGHTDEQGSTSYNQTLSQKRVESVRTWLVTHGIAEERLVAKGYGEANPIVPNARTEDEHQKNRRVQFVIVERSGPAPEAKSPGDPRLLPEGTTTLPPAPGESLGAPTAPSPDAAPFTDVGQKIRAGQVLCIVEAMKLMNEIESDVAGTILEILAENGKPVEYGDRLFKVKKD